MKILISILASIAMLTISCANNNDEMSHIYDKLFQMIEKEEINNIFTEMYSESPTGKYLASADLENWNGEFAGFLRSVGKLHGYELLHEQGVEGIYWHKWFILRFERQPLIIKFEFYKPKSKWRLHSLGYDSDLDDYIEKGIVTSIAVKGRKKER